MFRGASWGLEEALVTMGNENHLNYSNLSHHLPLVMMLSSFRLRVHKTLRQSIHTQWIW
jgi:hypothetical protein